MHVRYLGPFLFVPTCYKHNLRRTLSSPLNFEFGHSEHSQNVDLSYLPIEVELLPPLAERILRSATLSYIDDTEQFLFRKYGKLSLEEILTAIDQEYIYSRVPVVIQNKQTLEPKSNPDVEALCKILSFSAINRVPREITLILVDKLVQKSDETSVLSLEECFRKGGWTTVSFPKGSPLRLRRQYDILKKHRPWSKIDINQAVQEAAISKPPDKRKRKDEIFMNMNQLEVGRSYMAGMAQSPLPLTYNFFPDRRNLSKKILKSVRNTIHRIVSMKNGGFIVYLTIRLVWYSWRIITRLPLLHSFGPLFSSFNHRGIYVLLAFSLRILISVLLSPSAEEAFRLFIKMMNIRFEMAEVLIRFALFCDCILLIGQVLHP